VAEQGRKPWTAASLGPDADLTITGPPPPGHPALVPNLRGGGTVPDTEIWR